MACVHFFSSLKSNKNGIGQLIFVHKGAVIDFEHCLISGGELIPRLILKRITNSPFSS